tara:strand:+ start:257 stop:709 length:453 start_codon:yes stop_codon:yes gene_type:complete
MIIKCENCNKKFELNDALISSKGRKLKCGNCNHIWFFIPLQSTNITKKNITKPKKIINDETNNKIKTEVDEINNDNKEDENINKLLKKKKSDINYLKILIVIIISIIALILLADTFKSQLKIIIPNVEFYLNNLYQSLEDIKLFISDLTK